MKIIDQNLYYTEHRGTASHIGSVYGEELRLQMKEVLNRTWKNVEKRFNAQLISTAIGKMSEAFRHHYPYLWEEMEGICSGASLSMKELQIHLFSAGIRLFEDDGCSDILFPSSDVGPLLGKTHDATTPNLSLMVVRLIQLESLYDVLCVTRIDGISTVTGLNERGLAVGEASLHFQTTNKNGTVRNLLLRPLLHECRDVHEAVQFLEDHPPSNAGFHFALLDRAGNGAIVERSPTEQNVRWSQGEAVFCTNHTATPSMRRKEKSRGKEGDRNSDTRYEHLTRLTSNENVVASLDSLKNILTFHDSEGGICQHGDPDFEGEDSSFYPLFTQRAFINIVQSKTLAVSNGPPCCNDFFEFRMT